jgi:RimJ/RimL family protein N-acetyltransferase
MQRLDFGDYPRLQALFEGLRFNLVVDSILAGNTPAWAFADNLAAPQVGLLWDRQDGVLLAGDPAAADDRVIAALSGILRDEIMPDARARWIPGLTLLVDPTGWQHRFPELLPGRPVQPAVRRAYRFDGPALDPAAHSPPGYTLRRMDAALLADDRWPNMGEARGWVLSFWRSLADFERAGFGYCAIREDADGDLTAPGEVASWCLTVFAAGRAYELGLATVPEHRSRGLATAVAAACIAECLARDAIPHWHCEEANPASMAVAVKSGFAAPTRYLGYQFDTGL